MQRTARLPVVLALVGGLLAASVFGSAAAQTEPDRAAPMVDGQPGHMMGPGVGHMMPGPGAGHMMRGPAGLHPNQAMAEAMSAAHAAHLEAAVQDGIITQGQADAMQALMATHAIGCPMEVPAS